MSKVYALEEIKTGAHLQQEIDFLLAKSYRNDKGGKDKTNEGLVVFSISA